MNSLERMRKALKRKEPDRVPHFEFLVDKKVREAKTPQAKRLLQQQIEVTDREIDRLVYELYRLTDKEIEIVEEATQ